MVWPRLCAASSPAASRTSCAAPPGPTRSTGPSGSRSPTSPPGPSWSPSPLDAGRPARRAPLPGHLFRSYTDLRGGREEEGKHTRAPMPQSRPKRRFFAAAILLLAVGSGAAEPLFTLSEDGKTFLYRARSGDHPGVVAEMFGIPSRDVPAFLAANAISDATKVAAGFVYRIPNAAAQALAERTATLETENARLKRAAGEEKVASERLARAAEDARAEKALAESRATGL